MPGDEDQESSGPRPSLSQTPTQHRAGSSRRLVGRPPLAASTSSLTSYASQSSLDIASRTGATNIDPVQPGAERLRGLYRHGHGHSHGHGHGHGHGHVHDEAGLVAQVMKWLHDERARRSVRKGRTRHDAPDDSNTKLSPTTENAAAESREAPGAEADSRRLSSDSQSSEALERLERILTENLALTSTASTSTQDLSASRRPSQAHRRRSSAARKSKRYPTNVSSDTDYFEGDAMVPSCDAVLDNSKTLSYTGGSTESLPDSGATTEKAAKEQDWSVFKKEIVRLAHTLRLKGWRSVPLERGGDIEVERLSGALTNAVYVVSPPKDVRIVHRQDGEAGNRQDAEAGNPVPGKSPPKLLLRIYGPQVEQLIDRENELSILRRLARKKIGPRLLGTFKNGRFEQYFDAQTLTAKDIRNPDTSKQIAKRMRELHEGIELLEEERDAGPFIWRNWDKWVESAGKVVNDLDRQLAAGVPAGKRSRLDVWKDHGPICGVAWPVFKRTVETYRKWLNDQYGGPAKIRERLIFAHNDTQYGNLLRLKPSGESPLLLPANEHKQLIVIDFEYASANMRALEFANQFTEWCYDYHDPKRPYACNTKRYPTPEEQRRFIKAYVEHTPYQARPSMTPSSTSANSGPSSSISAFMLDSRASAPQIIEEEDRREKSREEEIERYLKDTRLWRVANSAQWVAWGVVQAKVPRMDRDLGSDAQESVADSKPAEASNEATSDRRPEGLVAEALSQEKTLPHEDDDEDEFDYLSYAHERALFFWGDVLQLGIVKEADLPVELLAQVKIVEY